jgi:hypothetical protein
MRAAQERDPARQLLPHELGRLRLGEEHPSNNDQEGHQLQDHGEEAPTERFRLLRFVDLSIG